MPVGRRNAQVKVRGFRIEPTAVEQAILQIDGVRQAAVLLREVASGERLLVGYVVSILEVDAIRTHLRATLPSYMIPDGFIPLDALPLTANGKLDRAALPAFTPSQRSLRAPTTPLEQRLVAIWEQTLNRTGISIDDDFFAIGGNSLNAAQIAAIIKRKMRVSLRVIALFHAPTIAQLARTIDDQRANVPEPLVVLLRQGTDASRPPLFLLHGVGGEILNYAPLARHLHAELTVYDSTGAVVASNSDGAWDGRNARLSYDFGPGTYKVRVGATTGSGEYVVNLRDRLGDQAGNSVRNGPPQAPAAVAHPPESAAPRVWPLNFCSSGPQRRRRLWNADAVRILKRAAFA